MASIRQDIDTQKVKKKRKNSMINKGMLSTPPLLQPNLFLFAKSKWLKMNSIGLVKSEKLEKKWKTHSLLLLSHTYKNKTR